ncbi:MAG: SDR family NAD(P)-dependent oxidoreductase, partial [Campylobacterales bacterium]|nr:SDR family NAD(P)-dependent oxidoreductase [Campylobacterales bacterium]
MFKQQNNKPVAFITGSSRGIGYAIAYALAQSGFDIVLHGKNNSKHLQQAKETITQKTDAKVLALFFDMGDFECYGGVLEQILSCFGTIDCLVNNAGTSVKNRGDLLDVGIESFDEQI